MQKIILHVSGTHCSSCKILIEDILNEQEGIENTQVDLKKETVSFEINLAEDINQLADRLSEKTKHNGHTFSVEKKEGITKDAGVIWQALPIGLAFLALFFILQKSGLLNIGLGGKVTLLTSFAIGLIASVSTCLAVVGGLVLSLSAQLAEDDKKNKKVFVLFHASRVISFALLGGVLGMIGSAIGISFTFGAILGILASVVMIGLGLSLVGVFEKSNFTLPAGIFKVFRKVEHGVWAPILVGLGTFFLPCGFTQSMQIQALASESFFGGASIMLFFALGTLPMLAFLSFTSVSFANSKYAPLFFRSAGIVVIGLGVFALLAGLAGLGIIQPLFNV
ncbi:MAG: urease accessory protein UreH domain-containing protein [Minisyncoccota bacterium]